MTQNPDELTPAAVDSMLQVFTDAANKKGLSLSLTLSVGGLLISGQLIGIYEYYEAVAKDFEKAASPIGDAFAEQFQRLAQEGRPERESKLTEEAEDSRAPSFIHLGEARVFHPGGRPIAENRAIAWRVRLSAVDGFSFGTLSPGS